jgi:hypothetical protein
MQRSTGTIRRFAAALCLALACAAPAILTAHEIPNDVLIQSFVRAEGQELRLLVRVPIAAMRDISWPQKATTDILDLGNLDTHLQDAATLWVGDEVKVYEDGQPIGPQRVVATRATPADDRSFETYDSAMALLTAPQREADVSVAT